jgi:hypothetical protein
MAKKLFTTPKGIAVFPHLHAPDTKFDKAGVWVTKLALEGADAAALRAQIDEAMAKSLAEAKADAKNKGKKIKQADAPYSVDLDDNEQETGRITFTFKLKATGIRADKTTYTQQPRIYDAAQKELKIGLRIGGGSVLRLSYEMSLWHVAALGAGVSLKLRGVQIVELKEFGGDASYYGFGAEEGGFVSEGAAPAVAAGFEDTKSEEAEEGAEETDF